MATDHVAPPLLRLPITPPRGVYYGWVIIGVVWMANFTAAFLSPPIFTMFIAPMRQELGFTLSQLAWVSSVGQVSAGIMAPIVGRLIDAYGTRWLGVVTGVVGGTCLIALSFVSNIWTIYLLFACTGATGLGALGAGNLIATVPPGNWFVAKRGRAMAVAMTGGTLGVTLGIPLAQFLIQTIGWRNAWVTFGIMMYIMIIPAYGLLMRRRPEDHGLHPDGAVSAFDPALTTSGPRKDASGDAAADWTLRQALRTPVLWAIIGLMTLSGFAQAAILFMRVPFWTSQGVPAQTISFAVPIDPFTVLVGSLILGFVAERVPVQLLWAFGGTGRASSMLPLLFMQGSGLSVLAHNFLWGCGASGQNTAANLIIPQFFGRRFQGSIRGIQVPLMIAAAAAGAPVAASLVDAGMNPNYVWTAAMAIFLTCGFGFLLVKRPKLGST